MVDAPRAAAEPGSVRGRRGAADRRRVDLLRRRRRRAGRRGRGWGSPCCCGPAATSRTTTGSTGRRRRCPGPAPRSPRRCTSGRGCCRGPEPGLALLDAGRRDVVVRRRDARAAAGRRRPRLARRDRWQAPTSRRVNDQHAYLRLARPTPTSGSARSCGWASRTRAPPSTSGAGSRCSAPATTRRSSTSSPPTSDPRRVGRITLAGEALSAPEIEGGDNSAVRHRPIERCCGDERGGAGHPTRRGLQPG